MCIIHFFWMILLQAPAIPPLHVRTLWYFGTNTARNSNWIFPYCRNTLTNSSVRCFGLLNHTCYQSSPLIKLHSSVFEVCVQDFIFPTSQLCWLLQLLLPGWSVYRIELHQVKLSISWEDLKWGASSCCRCTCNPTFREMGDSSQSWRVKSLLSVIRRAQSVILLMSEV